MVMDSFKEQLVKPESSIGLKVANIFMWILFVATFIFFVFGAYITALIFVAVGLTIFFTKKFLFVEYEYSFTNGIFEIDAIYQRKTRKKIIEFEVKDTLLFAPIDSNECKSSNITIQKTIDAVPKGNTDKVYCVIASNGAEKTMINMVPNEDMIDLCYMKNPRIVKKY